MEGKLKVSQPRCVYNWTPRHGLALTVTDGNQRKADFVATSWQQVFICSVCKEEKNRQSRSFKSSKKALKINWCLGKEIPDKNIKTVFLSCECGMSYPGYASIFNCSLVTKPVSSNHW